MSVRTSLATFAFGVALMYVVLNMITAEHTVDTVAISSTSTKPRARQANVATAPPPLSKAACRQLIRETGRVVTAEPAPALPSLAPIDWFRMAFHDVKFDSLHALQALRKSEREFIAAIDSRRRHLPDETLEHALAADFPLPETRMLLVDSMGICLLDRSVCAAAAADAPSIAAPSQLKRSTWNPQSRLRALLVAIFLKCELKDLWNEPACLALELGVGVGEHTSTMLALHSRVLGIEADSKKCFAAQYSIAFMGKRHESHILCGSVTTNSSSSSLSKPSLKTPTKSQTFTLPALLTRVPKSLVLKLFKLSPSVPNHCSLMQDMLLMNQKHLLQLPKNLIFQACDSSCSASALKALMLQLWQHQYIIYRLSGDPMRSEKPDLFATLRRTIVSFGWKEKFSQRYNLALSRAERVDSIDWNQACPAKSSQQWFVFATREI